MSEKTRWQQWKENLGDTRPWDLLNSKTPKVSESIYKYRYESHCLNCPSLIKATKQCKKCGCFMSEKAKLAEASCPIGRWGAITNVEDVIKDGTD